MATTPTTLRVQFFDYLFGKTEGYLCIATATGNSKKDFRQQFFRWPEQRANIGSFIESAHRKNVWFCTSLLEKTSRKKEFCLAGNLLWADLDECDPAEVEPLPSAIIESSPGRWQALWRLDETIEPYEAEDLNRKIAYKYNVNGADPSGWDLTQLLRVPLTFNYKYSDDDPPQVELHQAAETLVPVSLVRMLEPAEKVPPSDIPDVDMPDPMQLPDPEHVIFKYATQLRNGPFTHLYGVEPNEDDDWSAILWRFINICLEAGMSEEETFALGNTAACNKYARDNRPIIYLWRDIVKAAKAQKKLTILTGDHALLTMPEIINADEVEGTTFINDYKDWASDATDAVTSFHELSAFILLSAVCASGIRLELDYGSMVPNLWGLILGESTLTRKTTAMRMAMDIIADVDPEMILATDGSAEGLLTGLSTRPSRTSIYYKDEVSGFFDSINRKDYLAGMPETLTQLYDVPRIFTRRLRKETITISSPTFIFFGGGIRDKVYSLVSDEYVLSGFLPRFLVVSGDADLTRIRRTGPKSHSTGDRRDSILRRIANLHETHNRVVDINIGGQTTKIASTSEAVLTDDAWQRYGDIEELMVHRAHESPLAMLALPTFERLSRSLLKMSTLLAAAETEPTDGKFAVEEKHIIHAAHYIQDWGRYTVDLVQNSGKGTTERVLDKIHRTIQNKPDIARSELMQRHHLTSRETTDIMNTLIDRGLVTARKEGKGTRFTSNV
jgi:hypothetical protein